MKTDNRTKYIAINLISNKVFLCATKTSLGTAISRHLNSLALKEDKKVIGDWLVIKAVDQ